MKKIIAYSKQYDADQHLSLDWFQCYGESLMRNERPCILRFTDGDVDFNRTEPYFDCDNDIMLTWYKDESDLEDEDYCDYGYLTTMESITFLFDDGTIKKFATSDGSDIRQNFDNSTEQPTGVFEELVNFLREYMIKGGYKDEELYAIEEDGFDDI